MIETILSETPVFDLSDATICLIALSVAVLVLLFLLVRIKINSYPTYTRQSSSKTQKQGGFGNGAFQPLSRRCVRSCGRPQRI